MRFYRVNKFIMQIFLSPTFYSFFEKKNVEINKIKALQSDFILWFDLFLYSRAEFVNFFVGILVQTTTPKGNFEITWPLKQLVFCWNVILPNPIMNMQFPITKYDTPNFNQQNSCINKSAYVTFFHINWILFSIFSR